MTACSFYNEGTCQVASELAGLPVVFDVRACEVCQKQSEPMARNRVTVDIAVHAMRHGGRAEQAEVLYSEFHGREIKFPETEQGVGTELKKLIGWFWSPKKRCGSCSDRVRKMNKWGPEKCRRRKPLIVVWLKQSARKHNIPFSETVAGAMIELAIWNYQRKQAKQAKASIKSSKPVATIADDPRWAVAITTAPRRDCTLKRCIESVRGCGWEPFVFAEPGSTVTDARTIWNETRQGVWRNWMHSARWCLENTQADWILTVQDDSLFHPDCKYFIQTAMWPREDCGFLSLYTPKHYTIHFQTKQPRPPGINRIFTRSLWGACALVWPREILKSVIEHPRAVNWIGAAPAKFITVNDQKRRRTRAEIDSIYEKRKQHPEIIANSDTAIGKILNSLGKSMWFVDPSPVQHIARFSTIGHGGNDGRRNAYRIADHSIPLCDQVPVTNVVSLKV